MLRKIKNFLRRKTKLNKYYKSKGFVPTKEDDYILGMIIDKAK